MQITYDKIQEILINYEVEGSKVICWFSLPGKDEQIESTGRIKRLKTVRSQASRIAQKQIKNQLRRQATKLLRNVLGSGILGRTSSKIMSSTIRNNNLAKGFSQEEINAGVVNAFEKVANQFEYNSNTGSWALGTNEKKGTINIQKSAEEKPTSIPKIKIKKPLIRKKEVKPHLRFEDQLERFPIKKDDDKKLLARMLSELAHSDGLVEEEEIDFFNAFLSDGKFSFQQIADMPSLTSSDFYQIDRGVTETLLMLASTIILVDLDLADAEKRLIEEYARMLRINEANAKNVLLKSQYYILYQALSEETDSEQFEQIYSNLGMSSEAAQLLLNNI